MAADELQKFIESGHPGMVTDLSSNSLQRAAEKMFTAQGKPCPVQILNRSGQTYIIRRDAIPPS